MALFLRLILLLFASVGCVLLVLLLLALVVVLLVSFVCNGAELGVQLELALEHVEGGGSRDLAPQIAFVLSQSNLRLAEVIRASWVMAVGLLSR